MRVMTRSAGHLIVGVRTGGCIVAKDVRTVKSRVGGVLQGNRVEQVVPVMTFVTERIIIRDRRIRFRIIFFKDVDHAGTVGGMAVTAVDPLHAALVIGLQASAG